MAGCTRDSDSSVIVLLRKHHNTSRKKDKEKWVDYLELENAESTVSIYTLASKLRAPS